MAKIVDPKIQVVGFGPNLELPNGETITPDEFVFAAANITYRDMNAFNEFIAMRENDKDLSKKVRNTLIKVAGAGHASMATTPGFWMVMGGNSSKMVDSVFTTARFSSSLMPSGRRVPIERDQILIPKSIQAAGPEAVKTFMETSEANIDAYEALQERGVHKQVASKIVQYGHKGGGFAFMPLETAIHFARQIQRSPESFPGEAGEIIGQIEDFIRDGSGMETTYFARMNAPRTGCVNPNIFHHNSTTAQELLDAGRIAADFPSPLYIQSLPSEDRDGRIEDWLKRRSAMTSHPERIAGEWQHLLGELEEIVENHNDSVAAQFGLMTSWRVWGELKRHRTMPQTTESVYSAVERARGIMRGGEEFLTEEMSEENADFFKYGVEIPKSVKKDPANLGLWLERFNDSIKAYEHLTEMGIPEGDAITVIPRGLKLASVHSFDLFNMTTGYGSLRTCKTAEPEMRSNTEKEMALLANSSNVPESVKGLFGPKCASVGFCPETKYCSRVFPFVKGYDQELHETLTVARGKTIVDLL
ncbi:hypothetical protein HOD88_01035 [archaeon]|jgi:thymidylate synthase ThyX|nr:hypothetical protein [archaeon]